MLILGNIPGKPRLVDKLPVGQWMPSGGVGCRLDLTGNLSSAVRHPILNTWLLSTFLSQWGLCQGSCEGSMPALSSATRSYKGDMKDTHSQVSADVWRVLDSSYLLALSSNGGQLNCVCHDPFQHCGSCGQFCLSEAYDTCLLLQGNWDPKLDKSCPNFFFNFLKILRNVQN